MMERIVNRRVADVREEQLRDLFVRGLAGDCAAYHAFLEQLSAHLRAYYRRRLSGLPDEVEDLVQESLLAVHTQRHTYDAGQPLTAWIHAIAKYKLVDLFRRRAARDVYNDSLNEDHALLAESDTNAVTGRLDVTKLLERLPPRQRMLIVHMKLSGYSVVETARMTGLSESAVKVGVHRGLKALAAMVKTHP